MRDAIIKTCDALALILVWVVTLVCGAIGAFIDGGSVWALTALIGLAVGFIGSAFLAGTWVCLSGIYANTRSETLNRFEVACMIKEGIRSSGLIDEVRKANRSNG